MKTLFALVATLALAFPGAAQSVDAPDAARQQAPAPAPANEITGVLLDVGGGLWVTVFHVDSGLVVMVPHDPALSAVTILSLPPSAPFLIPDVDLGTWLGDNDDDRTLPATAGSGHCWSIPYGPPNPDGTWPVQADFIKITGHGGVMSQALADYKAKVEAAIEDGATPAPSGSC